MKKILVKIVYIFFFLTVIIAVIDLTTGFNPASNLYHLGDAYDGLSGLAAKLNNDIAKKTEGSVSYYIKNIDDSELQQINYSLNNINGSVKSIKIYPAFLGIRKVDFEIERSDNSYVIDAYLTGAPIPEERAEAIHLYHKVCLVLDTCIKNEMTEYEKEKRLHDYIIKNCEYSFGSDDNDHEYRAYGALVEGQAVCNGYAEAFSLLLSCAGIENEFVVGTATSDGEEENHAWNHVRINGEWYNVDSTWDDPVGENNIIVHVYFNVTDDILWKDHYWDKEAYKKCDSKSWNYYNREGIFFTDQDNMIKKATEIATFHGSGVIELGYSGFAFSPDKLQEMYTSERVTSLSYMTLGSDDYNVLVVVVN